MVDEAVDRDGRPDALDDQPGDFEDPLAVVEEGFDVVAESGILFMPGGLRMLDLLAWTRAPGLSRLTGILVAPFGWLSNRLPRLHRHGYLIAAVAVRPAAAPGPSAAADAGRP